MSGTPIAQVLIDELRAHRLVLLEIRDELRSWRAPDTPGGPQPCAHPIEQSKDYGSMGSPWIRCGLCKTTLTGGPE